MSPVLAPATFPELFAAQVRARPDAIAVVFEDVELSYAQLDVLANRLAHALIERGAGPERVVALAVPRPVELIVAELAVLKAGAAYLPVDVDYPAARIAAMIADAAPVCVVTTVAAAGALPADLPRVLAGAGDFPDTAPNVVVRPDNAAYVIFTSGSSGRPKGVVVSHAGVAKSVATQVERLGVGPESRVLQFASPSFDVAFFELCLGLLSGGRLMVVPAERRVAGPALTEYVAAHGVNVMILPPALLAEFPVECELPADSVLLAGTERVSPRFAAGRRMFNAYGPTEVTVNSTLGACDPADSVVPIGIPDPDTRAYVLGLDEIGIDDDLFTLGGHSMLLVLLRNRIREETGLEPPLSPRARWVALVGASGAGKTTVAKLIAGIHPPDAGTIRAAATVLVTQEVRVFAGPLADDLRLADPHATDQDLINALDRVGAVDWVRALPNGIGTVVGEGGHRLTPAQSQHIALCRLVLADPPVAILDESTAEAGSAGAIQLEAAASAALAGRGALIIAHRLSQAASADRVVVLERGRVVESGPHNELVAADGPYATLWRTWSTSHCPEPERTI